MLNCKNLGKSFDKKLFENLNLVVNPGEIVGLTGSSGSGKTTLLRIICGLEKPDSGEVYLNDENITNSKPESRGIGMIFQSPVLYPHLNVEGNLRLGDKNGDIDSALEEIGMQGFHHRNVESLSGGEGQRVALARALLAKPKILLLDEPFSSLDEELAHQLVKDVKSILKQRNCSAIFVTHDKNIAKMVADRIISI